MNLSSWQAGFLQALALAAYVLGFAFVAQTFGPLIGPALPEVFAMALFLFAFVTSALTCGAIALSYPLFLMFEGRRIESIFVVVWNILGLIVLGALALSLALFLVR